MPLSSVAVCMDNAMFATLKGLILSRKTPCNGIKINGFHFTGYGV